MANSKQIAIIGANGLLGVNLCHELSRNPDTQIIAIDRFSTNSRISFSPNIRLVRSTIAELVIQPEIFVNVDVVVYLASGLSPGNTLGEAEIFHRKLVFNELLDTLHKSGVNKFVFASTGGAMFVKSELSIHSETEIPSPQSQYAIEKLDFERDISLSDFSDDADCVIFRGSNFYGLPYIYRKNHGLIPRLINCAKTGEAFTLIGTGEEIRDFVDVRDVSKMLSKLINFKTQQNLYNIGSGIGTSVNEVISLIKTISGSSIEIIQVDAPTNFAKNSILNVERIQKEFSVTAQISLIEGISQFWDEQNNRWSVNV